MDLYNNYQADSTIELNDYNIVKKTTSVQKIWTDSYGDIHLDVQIDCTNKDNSVTKVIIPDLCVPMDGLIHLHVTHEPRFCVPYSHEVWYELKHEIKLNKGKSSSPIMPSKSMTEPYYVAVQHIDPPVKEMTLDEIEQKLGYKVKVVTKNK